MSNLNELTVAKAKQLLEKKEISAAQLTQDCLQRIDQTEGRLNALITVCADQAMDQAKNIDKRRAKGEKLGVLAGIPGIMKDNICTKGVLTTSASKMLYNYKPVYDATVIEKLNAEDYILLAKGNMDEFAMGSSNETSYFGAVGNPWDTDKVAGGSSGGCAAGMAADEGIFALGSDTGGSVRQPAAFCGVVGFKPTYGTVSRFGVMPFASSLDQVGTITKTVEDAALVFDVISGNDPKDATSTVMDYPRYGEGMKQDIKGLRVGVPRQCLNKEISDPVRAAFMATMMQMEDLGAIVEEVDLPTFDYALSAYYVIAPAEASSNLARFDGIRYGYRAGQYDDLKDMYRKTRTEAFGDEVKRRIMLGNYVLSSGYYDAYYLKALKARTLIKNDYDRLFETYDVLLTPMTSGTAFKKGSKAAPMEMYVLDLFTVSVNIAGAAAISIPVSTCGEGMPIGVQVISKAFDENTLFRAAYNLEQEIAFDKKPNL